MAAKKFSTIEKLMMAGIAAGIGYGVYRYATKAPVSGEVGEVEGDDEYEGVVSTHSARAARERSRVAREEARQARLSARGQRQRAMEAKALADRRAKEAIAAEQLADTKERMLRHTEALDADLDLYA